MLGNSTHLETPRRVVVYFLLFALAAVLWLAACAVVVSESILTTYNERELLTFLGRASTAATLQYLRSGPSQLQPLVERFGRERSLLYCAIVSRDRVCLAHSWRGRVGQPYEEPVGEHFQLGELEAVRFSTGGRGFVCEYRAPLEVRGEVAASLRVAVQEPDVWSALAMSARHAPLTLFGPMVLLGIGAYTLHRMVRPLSTVESQLRRAAVAVTLADIQLQPVKTRTASAVGWNRLIERLNREPGHGGLDQRLSEAVQAMRQEKADDVLNSLSDGVAVTDHEGRITFANHAMAALFASDHDPDWLRRMSMESVLGLEVEGEADGPLLDAKLRARHVVQEITRDQGMVQHVLRIARHPIRSADRGANAGHVWSARDVTQQKLAEAMRDQFLDSATHELRTPLANIKAYAETLAMSDMIDVESQKEFCNTINSEATRLARFIDDLLSISSMEVGAMSVDRKDVDVGRMFSEVVAKVKPQMDQKKIIFDAIFPEKYPQLKLDKDKVVVALVNLLGNAAKYTPQGGHVALKVKVTDEELRVEVEDTGVGIAEEEQTKIFDKFYRSSNPEVQEQIGTGLGLSMAREVVRLHGGDITVRSKLGKGTTFTATLPLKRKDGEAA